MALYTRENLPELLAGLADRPLRVFLLFGERYLCREAMAQLEQALLRDTGGTVHPIDGDQEELGTTLAKLRSFTLLPGRQIYRVTDTRLFHSRQVAKSIWDRAVKSHAEAKAEQAKRGLRAFLASGGLDPAAPDSDPAALSASEWQQCFGFARPDGDLSWTRAYLALDNTDSSTSAPSSDPGDLLTSVLATGIPANNVLILMAEEIDKRKKLFKLLKDEQTVIDLSVETGSGGKAQKEQKAVLQSLIRQTLTEEGKTMAPALIDLLIDRVGFHPVAAIMELRKVTTYLGDRAQVTRDDLDLLVGRTRQEALFELTSALARRDLEQSLAIADRLQENGIHPLAVVATLRNFIRGLLLLRSLIEQAETGFQPTMSAAAFQQACLPRLKEHSQWKKELGGHPFALYMQCKTASGFPLPVLAAWLHHLLAAELRLKGSPVAPDIVLQHLLLTLLSRLPQKRGQPAG
ncbi:MAG: DNA polymerase III subunit delta [Desulfobulbus sp.]|jgi:DNA polymerase-3 subunit delta|uniref:DNA polymerase III subunit delta n=1 Tax=Desulfobulbus sp. TaxID=895 RepID=UPI002849201C|nr:DNA polymerase III subunit delta [Desulfobulbus sp.]MDR2550694.1 DNA polymerase III subunit delta [Desulfobulbus sp.]